MTFLNTVSSALALPPDESTVFTYDVCSSSSSPTLISLILKLHTITPYNCPSLMKTLSGIWSSQCRFLVVVSKHANGMFLVTFGCEGDKGRVLEGQPWHFSQSITIFAARDSSFRLTPNNLHYVPFWVQVYGIPFMCKSHDLARFIAMEVGDLIEIDKDTIKEEIGPYMHLRILLDVNLPIRRGMNIKFIRMGREFIKWLDFKYERLPDFCFFCGKLDHTKNVADSQVIPMTTMSSGLSSPEVVIHACQMDTMSPTVADSSNMGINLFRGQPDPDVRGKGLASASDVKRPSFQPHHAVVGSSVRSQLKRARSGEREDESSVDTTNLEQAIDRVRVALGFDNESLVFILSIFNLSLMLFFTKKKFIGGNGLDWSSKCFSRAGKEVLLKAVIQAILAYAMACFRLPVKIFKGIKAAMARFWWGSTWESRKIHWKSWKFLCQSKFCGGLGFRSRAHFNQAMLAKQAWRILKNPNSHLSFLLKAHYFPQTSILTVVPGHNPSFTWRSILWGRDLLASGIIWKVGNGTWDVTKLGSYFDESMIADILEVPVSGCYGNDNLIWERESSVNLFIWWQDCSNLTVSSAGVFHCRNTLTSYAATDSHGRKHSIGVVLMECCNQVKAGISTPFSGLVPPAVAEAKAVHQAIQWPQLLHLSVDVLMTDCKSIVDKLKSFTTEEDENITIRCRSTNDLESTAASSFKADPSSPYFSPSKTKDHHHGSSGRGMGFIDDFGAGVNGLTSCTESLGFESSDERRVEEDDHHVMDSVGGEELTLTSRPWSTSTATKAKCGGIRRRSIRDRHLYQNHEVKKFPPPLSSLNQNGQPSFYLQAVRKEGRLELTEVRIHRPEILRAFRENGRLRLQFIREDDDCDDAEEEEDCNDEKVEEKEKEVVPEEVIISEEKKEEEEEKDDGDDDDDQEMKIPVSSGEGLRRSPRPRAQPEPPPISSTSTPLARVETDALCDDQVKSRVEGN
uniref:DUF4283 domain-containing protein n=1 Tax=Cannabis sativa TaxID=3483 RepID=A0A803Q009_CANSA